MTEFEKKVEEIRAHHEALLTRKNTPKPWGNGIYTKYELSLIHI